MTDKFKGWYPDYIENEKEREPILKLAKMMTGRAKKKLGLEKMTKYDPEYWGLALLCTDEQAEIALKMGVRQPKTLDQMVKVTGKDRGYLEKQLEEMAEVALVEYNWENPQHEKQYVLPIFVPGSAEFSCMNAKMLEKHPELGLFFERMSRIALEGLAPFMPEGGVGMHVIPVQQRISLCQSSTFHIGLKSMRENMQRVHVLVEDLVKHSMRDVRMIRKNGVLRWAIWQIISLRQIKVDTILQRNVR